MNDVELRVECLRLAVGRAGVGQSAEDLARTFYAFATNASGAEPRWRDRLPETAAVTFEEGGKWHDFPVKCGHGHIHAIRFQDGSIWDAVNGWRTRG